jgi:Na+/H+ antiporter NhaD/arsenite permease-like protein
VLPLIASGFWHKHEKKVFILLPSVAIILSSIKLEDAAHMFEHTIVGDYFPFIITLFVLYILSNGIKIKLNCRPTSFANIAFLLVCSVCSSVIGTTGASILFLRPFLDMNAERKNKAHLVVFFIFLVSNIGGILSPLGDPPLFLGYLHGIDFTWEIRNLSVCWAVYTGLCLTILYCIDRVIIKKETLTSVEKFSVEISGLASGILLIIAIAILSVDVGMTAISKNALLLTICFTSYCLEKKRGNNIDVSPFREVAETFLAIFVAMSPVLVILSHNSDEIKGFIASVANGANESSIYFWLCSLASSFLDNAPSYLLFFNIAGGNGHDLMHTFPDILKAISISSVVMGSMTYIGNAPNMLVRSISRQRGIRMPSFAAYMLWSALVILPISILVVNILL